MSVSTGTVYVYPNENDFILRARAMDATGGEYDISLIGETSGFVEKLLNPFFENVVLRTALRNIWKAYQYDQEYISYLLNTWSKDEFMEKAKEFAQSFEEIDEDQLHYGANLILNTLDQPLTSAEISLFFNVDPCSLNQSSSILVEYCPDDMGPE